MYIGNMHKNELAVYIADIFNPMIKKVDLLTDKVNMLEQKLLLQGKEYITVKEVGVLMDISRGTVINYTKEGRLIRYNISDGKVLYKTSEVNRYIELTKSKKD